MCLYAKHYDVCSLNQYMAMRTNKEGYQDTNRQRLHQDLNKRVFLTEICVVIGSVL